MSAVKPGSGYPGFLVRFGYPGVLVAPGYPVALIGYPGGVVG